MAVGGIVRDKGPFGYMGVHENPKVYASEGMWPQSKQSDIFMSGAFAASRHSPDKNKQVGVCIINERNHIIAMGYNRLPKACEGESEMLSNKEKKYYYIIFAAVNAILRIQHVNGSQLEKCRLYTTVYPDHESAKAIVECGIKQVIFVNASKNEERNKATKRIFESAKVETYVYENPCSNPQSDNCLSSQQTTPMDALSQCEESLASDGSWRSAPGCEENEKRFREEVLQARRLCHARSEKVGVCIVDDSNNVISKGWNRIPKDCSTDLLKDSCNVHYYIVFAGVDAISSIRNRGSLRNCRLYSTLYPDHESAKAIVESGIRVVIFMNESPKEEIRNQDRNQAVKKIFLCAKVKTYLWQNEDNVN